MSTATHTLDVYGVELHLATTEPEWRRLRKRVKYLEDVPDSAGLTHFAVWMPNDGGVSIPVVAFWIRDAVAKNPAELIQTCGHEASHASNYILGWTGHDVRGNDGKDEPSAYLTGWLTWWLWEHARPKEK